MTNPLHLSPAVALLLLVRFDLSCTAFVPAPSTSSVTRRPPCSSRRECSRGMRLGMSIKDNNRARVEKNFEDMMGDDWRVFRAKLVAQERADKDEATVNSVEFSTGADIDEKMAKQERIGNMFVDAISSIFSSKNGHDNIFDGDAVGGATPSSMIDVPSTIEDPFVSAAEIPTMMQPKVHFNKHRWAHPISHIEPGCVLVANEKLGGVFHQTIVLVVDHHDALGSTGMVINRPLPGNLLKVVSDTDSKVDLSLKMAFNSAPVAYGGPVMHDEFSILHGYGEVPGSRKVAPGVFVGGSDQLMQEVRRNKFHPSEALFIKGHAEWVPGQLAREIEKGVWYTASASSDFILRYAGAPVEEGDNQEDLWSDILACMGGSYSKIASVHAGRGDNRMMP